MSDNSDLGLCCGGALVGFIFVLIIDGIGCAILGELIGIPAILEDWCKHPECCCWFCP